MPHSGEVDSGMIPRILHRMWIGSPAPEEFTEYTRQWFVLHPWPHWNHRVWGENNIPLSERSQELWDNAFDISSEPYQYRADVARYEILNKYGGVWVDMDFKPQKPIDDLCGEGVYAWMAWEAEPYDKGRDDPLRRDGVVWYPGYLNNAIMASTPGHPFLHEAIRLLPEGAKRKGANTVKSGPQFITPIATKYGVTTYPKDFFYPYLWNELDREGEEYPDAYAVHLWNNRRKRK